MEQKYDMIEMKIESRWYDCEGNGDRTKLEKDVPVVTGFDTTLSKTIEVFIDFLKAEGYSNETIADEFEDLVVELRGH